MEKLETSLVEYINKTEAGELEKNLPQIANQLTQIFRSLDYQKIYHRDLHLGNFMIKSEQGGVKVFIVDFGDAVHAGSETNTSYNNPFLDMKGNLQNWLNFVLTQAFIYSPCKKNQVTHNKKVCDKIEIALRLAKKVDSMNGDANWNGIVKKYGLPKNIQEIPDAE
jgi:serine/threonine protein kinase